MKYVNPIKIVISGGPGTGKTMLIRELEQRGFPCFHEIIREFTSKVKSDYSEDQLATNPLAFVDDPLEFNRALLKGRIAQFHLATDLEEPLVFFDRGLPDIIAYMDYFDQGYDSEFTDPCKQLKYDAAVILQPWQQIYKQDNERLESFEEACDIHHYLEASYKDCDYTPVEVPFGPVSQRADHLLQWIRLNYDL